MQSTGLAKKYEGLTPRERLRLMLESMARDDQTEQRRLWQTCTRRVYSQPHTAFAEPYDTITQIVQFFAAQISKEIGHLETLQSVAGLMPLLLMHAGDEGADVEFMKMAEAEGQDAADDGVHDVESADAEGQTGNGIMPADGETDLDSPMPSKPLTRRLRETAEAFPKALPFTHILVESLFHRLMSRRAARVGGMVLGLERFSQRLLGLKVQTLLQALAPHILESLDELNISAAEPDESWATEIEELAWEAWSELVNL